MTVNVMFRDVLDLVPQSTVKVDDVTVGKVTGIELKGYVAQVTIKLPGDVDLPATPARRSARPASSARSSSRSASRRPRHRQARRRRRHRPGPHRPQPGGGRGPRRARPAAQRWRRGPAEDHRHRAQQRDRRPGVRDPLGARPDPHLHGPARPRTRPPSSPRSTTPTGSPCSSASRTVRSRAPWTTFPRRPALGEPPARRPGQDAEGADRLSGVGVRVIRASKASTINSLRDLAPVLTASPRPGRTCRSRSQVFLTYPFVDAAIGRDPQVARNLHMGDFTNLSVNLDLNVADLTLPGLPPVPSPACDTCAQVRRRRVHAARRRTARSCGRLKDAEARARRHRPDRGGLPQDHPDSWPG